MNPETKGETDLMPKTNILLLLATQDAELLFVIMTAGILLLVKRIQNILCSLDDARKSIKGLWPEAKKNYYACRNESETIMSYFQLDIFSIELSWDI